MLLTLQKKKNIKQEIIVKILIYRMVYYRNVKQFTINHNLLLLGEDQDKPMDKKGYNSPPG